jgi:hypothetical protein
MAAKSQSLVPCSSRGYESVLMWWLTARDNGLQKGPTWLLNQAVIAIDSNPSGYRHLGRKSVG